MSRAATRCTTALSLFRENVRLSDQHTASASRPWPPAVHFALFSPARRPSAVTQPVHFAAMALLDHRACRMVAESGGTASPSRRPWLETALFTAPAGNPRHLQLRWWLENPVENPLVKSHTLGIPARGVEG